MPENDGLRRFLKAGVVVAEVTRARAGGMLSELIKTGEVERDKAQDWVESLWKTNRDRPAAFIATVRGEVRKPFGRAKITTVGGRAGEGSELSPPPPAVAAKKPTGARPRSPPGEESRSPPGRGQEAHRERNREVHRGAAKKPTGRGIEKSTGGAAKKPTGRGIEKSTGGAAKKPTGRGIEKSTGARPRSPRSRRLPPRRPRPATCYHQGGGHLMKHPPAEMLPAKVMARRLMMRRERDSFGSQGPSGASMRAGGAVAGAVS